MNLKNQLQRLIDYQIIDQKTRFESIGFKKDEALKFENFAEMCYRKIKDIEKEIKINKKDIIKLQAILDKL